MNPIVLSNSDFEQIAQAKQPEIAIHTAIHSRYAAYGYNPTLAMITQLLQENRVDQYHSSKQYLMQRVEAHERFSPHQEELLAFLLANNGEEKLNTWVLLMERSHHRKAIYDILLEFSVFIQYHPSIKTNEEAYDKVVDLLDTFVDVY